MAGVDTTAGFAAVATWPRVASALESRSISRRRRRRPSEVGLSRRLSAFSAVVPFSLLIQSQTGLIWPREREGLKVGKKERHGIGTRRHEPGRQEKSLIKAAATCNIFLTCCEAVGSCK